MIEPIHFPRVSADLKIEYLVYYYLLIRKYCLTSVKKMFTLRIGNTCSAGDSSRINSIAVDLPDI